MKNPPVCLAALSLLLAVTIHAQNLLSNGSFENLNVSSSDASTIAGQMFTYGWDGTSDFTPIGWTGTFGIDTSPDLPPSTPRWITVASGNPSSFAWPGAESLVTSAVDPSGGTFSPLAEDGSIYLQLETTATISQTINTVVGQSYNLSFWVGASGDTPYSPNGLTGTVVAYINGISLGNFTETANVGDELDWKQYNETFTATSTSTTIGFGGATDLDLSDSPYYVMNGLDNASVTPNPAPEPSSTLLIGTAGICAFSRPFFRKKTK
jgi:hypothetical protein